MADVELKKVVKIYPGKVRAVDEVSISIKNKEFIVFVGPSGCGKTTTLRMVAGLEDVTKGEVIIGGKLSNNIAPRDRNIAMVFQNYALYPHMTVYDNLGFGLKMRKTKKAQIKEQVEAAAEILNITPLLHRKPKALSGGEKQRVALGRAIIRQPAVFLLDEPLSNLDAKLRDKMRDQIKEIHNRLDAATIYVTHNQSEAVMLADRIVVMDEGKVQQIGTPREVYQNPANEFVEEFIGVSLRELAEFGNWIKGE